MQFGMLRRLIGLIDAGEVFDLSCQRPAVKPFRIAGNALLEWSIDEDLDEFASLDKSFTSIRCLSSVTVAAIVAWLIFMRYERPGSSSCSDIQTRWAAN